MGFVVECRNISIWDVRTAFHKANSYLFFPQAVHLSPLADDGEDPMINIYEDLLGIHSVTEYIDINCSKNRLTIHSHAFRLSGRSTRELKIISCDLNSTDLGFLSSFERLSWLTFKYCDHFDLALWSNSAPLLTNLNDLSIIESSDLNKWNMFPHLTRGLLLVTLSGNGIGNDAMDRILQWISSFSASTLYSLGISYNNLTRIPPLVSSFNELSSLDMMGQEEPGLGSLPSGALKLSPSLEFHRLNLLDCGITTIEPGAFQGVFLKSSEDSKMIVLICLLISQVLLYVNCS